MTFPAMVALLAITTQAQAVLIWDSDGSTLIAANLRDRMSWAKEFLKSES